MTRLFSCRPTLFALLALALTASLADSARAQWTMLPSGTKARLRGLSVASDKVVWASGTSGTFVVSVDGGKTWKPGTVTGAGDLDFRDVHAFDDKTAFLLSIGPGEQSRIYQTRDGGETWALRHQNRDPKVFLDALAFWDAGHGLALGDPVDGRFTILATEDGGLSWKPVPSNQMPAALTGEGAFAASGTCLVVRPEGLAWFGTGGGDGGRVFRSSDHGRTWTVHRTPIAADNASSGIFSLAFRTDSEGVAVGGDYRRPQLAEKIVAITSDGGRTWSVPQGRAPGGYRSAVVYASTPARSTLVAVGPTGSDFSLDGGQTWKPLGTVGFHAAACAGSIETCFAAGDQGTIARFTGMLDERRSP